MAIPGFADLAPWRDWSAAASGVLEHLHTHASWDAWMVTRVVGDRQVVLCARPREEVRPGASLPWAASFCHQMAGGQAPRVATVTAAVPAYASRTLPNGLTVAAYIGVPLVGPDMALFGTLCGISSRAQPRSATRDLPLVELAARLLSSLLAAGLHPGPVPARAPLPTSLGAAP